MKIIVQVNTTTKNNKSAERIFCKLSKKSIYVLVSHPGPIKEDNSVEPLLTAAILWPSADVWNLICKRLGHPLSVWELAFCRLGRGRLLSAF